MHGSIHVPGHRRAQWREAALRGMCRQFGRRIPDIGDHDRVGLRCACSASCCSRFSGRHRRRRRRRVSFGDGNRRGKDGNTARSPSPLGETITVPAAGVDTVFVPAFRVGSNTATDITITPLTRFELPPVAGANAAGIARVILGNGIGSPGVPALTLVATSTPGGTAMVRGHGIGHIRRRRLAASLRHRPRWSDVHCFGGRRRADLQRTSRWPPLSLPRLCRVVGGK